MRISGSGHYTGRGEDTAWATVYYVTSASRADPSQMLLSAVPGQLALTCRQPQPALVSTESTNCGPPTLEREKAPVLICADFLLPLFLSNAV